MPSGRFVRRLEGLHKFQTSVGGAVAVLPAGKHASNGEGIVLRAGQEMEPERFASHTQWYVIERRPATRLRVFASNERAMAVTNRFPAQGTVSDEAIECASVLAVQAVRAMPQRRWAAVDIAVVDAPAAAVAGQSESSAVDGCYIEDMAFRPNFRRSELLVAGSMKDVIDEILS